MIPDGDISERERRWRLIVGTAPGQGTTLVLRGEDTAIDDALGALYDMERTGDLANSAPKVTRWLGDIRKYFPSTIVQVMQQDALSRLHLKEMLLEPETLAVVQPDVHLVATLLSLNSVLSGQSRDTARQVVRKVVEDLERRLLPPMRQAVRGSLNRAVRNHRPQLQDMDWHRTIRANLKHYQPEYRTVIAETRIGFGRRHHRLRDIILCIDQSGSMATSVVYAGVFGCVLASLSAIRTRVIAFDTAVVDLTEHLQDPVDLLFGTQLGGGTDICQALTYCQALVERPQETILVLISDLYEGGSRQEMLRRTASLVRAGVKIVVLLALSDTGAPQFDRSIAAALAGMGIPSFACTPDQFPDLMAAAIRRQDLARWAAVQGIVTASPVAE